MGPDKTRLLEISWYEFEGKFPIEIRTSLLELLSMPQARVWAVAWAVAWQPPPWWVLVGVGKVPCLVASNRLPPGQRRWSQLHCHDESPILKFVAFHLPRDLVVNWSCQNSPMVTQGGWCSKKFYPVFWECWTSSRFLKQWASQSRKATIWLVNRLIGLLPLRGHAPINSH